MPVWLGVMRAEHCIKPEAALTGPPLDGDAEVAQIPLRPGNNRLCGGHRRVEAGGFGLADDVDSTDEPETGPSRGGCDCLPVASIKVSMMHVRSPTWRKLSSMVVLCSRDCRCDE